MTKHSARHSESSQELYAGLVLKELLRRTRGLKTILITHSRKNVINA